MEEETTPKIHNPTTLGEQSGKNLSPSGGNETHQACTVESTKAEKKWRSFGKVQGIMSRREL